MPIKPLFYNLPGKVRHCVRLFFMFFLLCSTFCASAQDTWHNTHLLEAYRKVLQLKFQESRQMLIPVNASDNHPVFYYIENLADVLPLLVTEDQRLFETLSINEEKREAALAGFPDDEPYKLFCLAEIKMQWAFVKLKYGEELNAVWDLRQAYKIIEENRKIFPGFLPNNKSLGLLHVIFGAVPDKYRWVMDLLGIHGSVTTGIMELKTLENTWLVTEATMISSLAHAYILQDMPGALHKIIPLYHASPDNLLLKYLYALLLIKNSSSEKAWAVLNEAAQLREGYPLLHMLDYLRGEVLLQKGDYKKASAYFSRFLLQYKGINFVKDAHLKLFLCHWLANEEHLAQQYFEKAKTMGATRTAADRYADKLLSADERPNKLLMRVRLHTDGGYFKAAESLLEKVSSDTFDKRKDKTEFYYRKARLLHKQNHYTLAIPLYKKTIEASGDYKWYFGPNSALQLGHIYLQSRQWNAARAYFEKALRYKGHPYKNSIDQKAKYGLEKLAEASAP